MGEDSDDEFLLSICRRPRPTEEDDEWVSELVGFRLGEHRPVHGATAPSHGEHLPAHGSSSSSFVVEHRPAHGATAAPSHGEHRPAHCSSSPSVVGEHRPAHGAAATTCSTAIVWPRLDTLAPLPKRGSIIMMPTAIETFQQGIELVKQNIAKWIWSSHFRLGYKIGITQDPNHRWSNDTYGYIWEGCDWLWMDVVVRVPAAFYACQLEKRLTQQLMNDPQCCNKALGGGGKSAGNFAVHYVYVVYRRMDAQPPAKRLRV